MVNIIRPGTKKAAPGKKAAPSKAAPSKAAARPRYDDDDDEAPARRPAAKSAANGQTPHVRGGDREADEVFAGGDFAKNLILKDGQTEVIRFLEDGPYGSFRIHWLERKGRRSYPCIGDVRKDEQTNGCPFCAYGMEWKPEARYNVAVLTDEDPLVLSLNVGKRVRKKIIAHGESNHGPLSRKFYFYTRIGVKFDTDYNFEVARTVNDIKEEFPNLRIPSEEELAELIRFTPDQASKEFVSAVDMRKIAKELMADDDVDE